MTSALVLTGSCPPCPTPEDCACDEAVAISSVGTPADGIVQGHVLDVLAALPAESASCIVTSPPYWSLRKYEAPDVTWPGNDPDCEHEWEAVSKEGAAVEGYAGKKK